MKLNKDEHIEWFDENRVDFSRKRRVTKAHSVSKKYTKFSPEDPMVDTNMAEMNPSVNKEAYNISNHFEDEVDLYNHKLYKGKHNKYRGSLFRDLKESVLDEILKDIDD